MSQKKSKAAMRSISVLNMQYLLGFEKYFTGAVG